MQRLLYGAARLTPSQRASLTDNAISLCVERNLVIDVHSKCVIAKNYREVWVFTPEHARGFRLI